MVAEVSVTQWLLVNLKTSSETGGSGRKKLIRGSLDLT